MLQGPKQFYIGSTGNLRRRITEHQANIVFSTKNRGPWKLVYYEASEDEKSSGRRKRYLKTAWGRRYLRTRIGG
ncbi:MAG: GIY-YIG nuclease family protein [Candidatus Kaiserbacteria bacterium]|nr:GIY-YIG nuclease family protein [Candidatus Kaiserbacteria bacterium]